MGKSERHVSDKTFRHVLHILCYCRSRMIFFSSYKCSCFPSSDTTAFQRKSVWRKDEKGESVRRVILKDIEENWLALCIIKYFFEL